MGKYNTDDEKIWTQDLRIKLGFEQKAPGICYISLKEFL